MRARTKNRSMLSAVVVTVAAGCGGAPVGGGGEPECCHNPPPIFTFERLEVGDRLTRDGALCVHHHAANGTTTQVECPPELASDGTIRRDGEECTRMPEVHCPPPSEATCNPPPPERIPCPESR